MCFLLANLSVFVVNVTAQSKSAEKPQRAYTGVGYTLCGSCSVPKDISWQVTLTSKDEAGDSMILSGTIYKEDGVTPASGITLFLYQTDAGGYYHRPKEDTFAPRLHGWLRTGKDGRYQIRTIKPAPEVLVPEEPAHIHVHVFGQGIPEHFLREFWFEGDPRIKSDDYEKLSKLAAYSPIVHLTKDRRGVLLGGRDIRLRLTKRWKYQND